jgi:hypothetical protein
VTGERTIPSSQNKTIISGGYHCGNVTFTWAASRPPEALSVRACGCRFCRQHAALSTSDPDGHVSFTVADPARLGRYRFGLKTADSQRFLQKSFAMDYGAEDEAGRRARRRAKWTPADLQVEVNR